MRLASSSWAASSSRVGARRSFRRQIRRPFNTVLMRVGAGAIRRPVCSRYWLRLGYAFNLNDARRHFARQTDDRVHFVDHDSGSDNAALTRRRREIHLESAFSVWARYVADPEAHVPQPSVRAGEADPPKSMLPLPR